MEIYVQNIKSFDSKSQYISTECTAQLQLSKKKTIDHYRKIVLTRIDLESESYNTKEDYCDCSENKLLSEILRIDVPCCHRLNLGAQFPPCPEIILNRHSNNNDLKVIFNILEEDLTNPENSVSTSDKKYAVEMIHRYGKMKDRKKITTFVDDNYNIKDDEQFIQCKPCSVHNLINDGILHFQENKKLTTYKK